jgi:hypothetical protein
MIYLESGAQAVLGTLAVATKLKTKAAELVIQGHSEMVSR